MKKVILMLLGIAFAGVVWADPSVVIQKPAEGEFIGFVSALDGFSLPLQLGASDADFNNPDGFAVKIASGGNTLYDKPDILFRKGLPTDLEINEGLHYDPENLIQTATITVKTPDGRITTRTFKFGMFPSGGVLIEKYEDIAPILTKVTDEEIYPSPLILFKTNDVAFVSGNKVVMPNLEDEWCNIYFAGNGKLDVSSIVPIFGTPYDIFSNFVTNNFVQTRWEWDEEKEEDIEVPYSLTTIEQQLAQFSNTNDVAKLVFDAKRKAISLIGRGESEDFPWILDASTNVTAWVDANKKLVIDNGLLANSYDIDLVAMTNNFAKYKYTAPANALVKVVNGSTTKTVTSKGWVGAKGTYATLGDALKAGEAKIVPGYAVSYDANGAAGVMTNSIFAVGKDSTLKANAYSAIGYDFAGWTLGTNTTVIADSATVKDLASVDGSATLTAKWNATGVSLNDFVVLTNTLVAATNQAASLPVTITLTDEIAVPQDGVITVNASPAITFAGEGTFDVSAIVPTFGTPTVVGEGFTSTNAPALFDTKGVSKLVYEDGTVSVVARGETEDFPWLLDAATNVTAWVEGSNLIINNGLTAESYEIDLVALTNNVATYSYTPASPLNAVVKVGEADYKTPKCWIGESGSYATLGAALEAGETTVLPGYEVVYEANGAAGSMTNSYFAAATEATLTANVFSAVGYDLAGWTTGTNTTVIAGGATVKDLAPVDGSATLTAKWNLNTNGVTVTSYAALTNTISTAGLQGSNLPITIAFTSDVTIPEDATLPTLPTGTGYDGLKYVAEEEGGSNLWAEDGVLYGDVLRGEVPVDALVLMQHAIGGSITEFKALSEGEDSAIVTNDVVMLLGDNRQAYFNDTDSVDQMIADILAADPRPTCVKLYEVKGAMVTFEAMGGDIGSGTDPLGNDYAGGGETITYLCIPDTGYVLPTTERAGYTFAGWFDSWKPGANEVTNNQEIVDYSEQSLYAQWISTAPTPKAGELHVEDVTNDVPVTEIAAKAYVNMTDIATVTTPLYLKKIGNRAFMGCTALEKLTITATRDYETLEPTKVTIEQNAFSGCTSLEELLIAGEIEKIGQSAFQNCAKLKKIIFRGDEAVAYDSGAFYRCGYANGTDELKVYMSSAFQAANAQLISDFQAWNTQVKIIDKIGVEPVTGETTVSIDPAGLVAGKRVAIVVQTSVKGTPDKEDVDIELSTDLATWTPITEGVEKTAYPDGTVMIEITVPNAPSGFFRAVVK